MDGQYRKPAAAAGLRLHLNENTAGCSPAVAEVLHSFDRLNASLYPDYGEAQRAVADAFEVPLDHLLLTNGLDEGILAAAAAAFRDRSGSGQPEALGVEPAFDMYEVVTRALGARLVTVPLEPDFCFPGQALVGARGVRTRIVFVTNPHNPTGRATSAAELLTFAASMAPVLVLVDEAYADFSGESLVDAETLRRLPNLLIGRTFAKAHGLAGLRAGAVFGCPETLAPLRQVVPPYSVNAVAAAALPVALKDRAYRDWYVSQARESRRLLEHACARLGLRTWPSAANFMLVQVGPGVPAMVAALAARGVLVRDRSTDRGCDGCIRMTTGLVEDTRRLIAALEEVVCGGTR